MKIATAFLAILFVPCLQAQQTVTDEQAIEGRSLSQLRKDVDTSQKRFYTLYNKLNQDSGYAVECRESETIGSRFKTRSCGARADAAADEQLGGYLSAMQQEQEFAASSMAAKGVNPGGLPTSSNRDTGSAKAYDSLSESAATRRLGALPANSSQQSLRAHIQELIDQHPELRQLADEHAAAVRRYELAKTLKAKRTAGK